MNKTIITIMCTTMLMLVGCTKTNANDNVSNNQTNIVAMSSTAITNTIKMVDKSTNVVLKVGTNSITYKQCDDQCRLLIALKENRNGYAFDEDQWMKEYRQTMKRIPNFFWYKTSFMSEAIKSNFTFTAVTDDFKKSYLKNVRKPRQSIDKLISSLGSLSNIVVNTMENDYYITDFINTTFSNELCVTEKDIKLAKKRIEDYNCAAEATNELAIAKASIVASAITNGVPIKEVIAKYSEDVWNEDRFDSLTIDTTDFITDRDWLNFKKCALRQPSNIYEIEDGYAMYYKVGEEDVETFEAYRIFFRRAELIEEMDDDEIKLELTNSKRSEVMNKFLPIAFTNNPIEFPSGKENFLKIFGL